MKLTSALLLLALAIGALVGCSNESEGTLSKQEVESLKNPQKEMPKEAFEAMQNAGRNRPNQVEGDFDGDGVPDNRGEKAAPPPGG